MYEPLAGKKVTAFVNDPEINEEKKKISQKNIVFYPIVLKKGGGGGRKNFNHAAGSGRAWVGVGKWDWNGKKKGERRCQPLLSWTGRFPGKTGSMMLKRRLLFEKVKAFWGRTSS